MAVEKYNTLWRKSLAIGILPFAALGVAGCDNSEPVEEPAAEEEVVEETTAATPAATPTGDTLTTEGEEDTLADEEVVEEDPTGAAMEEEAG
jgi:hypothetical protein